MFIKNLSKREKRIAVVTLVVVVVTFAYGFIIEPISKRWFELEREITQKTQILEKDSRILSMRKKIASDYASYAAYAKSTKKEEEEMAQILTEIESISRRSSCHIVNVNPQGVKNIGPYKEALVDVTTESDISQFANFLYSVEASKDMILKVKRFTLSSKSSQEGILRGSLLIAKVLLD